MLLEIWCEGGSRHQKTLEGHLTMRTKLVMLFVIHMAHAVHASRDHIMNVEAPEVTSGGGGEEKLEYTKSRLHFLYRAELK